MKLILKVKFLKNIYKLIQKIFRTTKENPKTWEECWILYSIMLRNVGGNDVILSKKIGKKKKIDMKSYII
jgi:hypothetical protein